MLRLAQIRRWFLAAMFILAGTGAASALEQHIGFTGGPDGGTFQYFSNGINTRLTQCVPNLHTSSLPSAGSVENIRRLNSREADFGIAYSGDLYLAHRGLLNKDPQAYRNTLAVAFLYGAPAQLIVLKESGIDTLDQLAGKRIAVGGAGSGSAATAQRFFSTLGLWDRLQVEFIGYAKAAAALKDHSIDAMWIMAGYPTAAVSQLAVGSDIRLLETWKSAVHSGLLDRYPFYSKVVIPPGTYRGEERGIESFQDAAIWIAGSHVPDNQIISSLEEMFSADGLAYLRKVKSTASQMSIGGGLTGIVTPLHPGARSFWMRQGVELPPGS